MRKAPFAGLFVIASLLSLVGLASAQAGSSGSGDDDEASERESRPGRGFGGSDQVGNAIAIDDETVGRIVERRLYEPWFEWKKGLQEKHGLLFSIDYSMAWLGASDSPAEAEDRASSGMVRFFGSWDLVGRESGNTGASSESV